MIHAIPGMGADRRMFPGPWANLPDFIAHDWPRYSGEHTLSDMACTVLREFGIRDGDTLVGSSLGGMIACELAKIRQLNALYLVGSATSKHEVSPLLALLHPLADVAPIEWFQSTAGKIPADLVQMFASSEPSFIRAMCKAIFRWEGLGSTPVRCIRIHGSRDLLISPPAKTDLLLDGGHLVSRTHAKECVDFIGLTMRWSERPPSVEDLKR